MSHTYHILDHVPALRECGFGIHHFPKYVNRTLQLHSVDVVLLSVIKTRGGPTKHVMDDEVFEEKGTSIAITHYGQEHDIVTSASGIKLYNIYMDLKNHPLPPLPQEFTSVLPVLFPLHPSMANRLNRRVRIAVAEPAPLIHLLDRWMHEEYAPQAGSKLSARAYLQLFLIECCRIAMKAGYTVSSSMQESPSFHWLERVRKVLDEKFAEPHTLPNLAAMVRVSPSHLSREFRKYSGKSLISYLNQRRIESAMLRLRTTTDKIVTISLDCGFEDLSRFNQLFKQLTGTTPSAYRKSF
jgi:AraC-like DNA-binding protein